MGQNSTGQQNGPTGAPGFVDLQVNGYKGVDFSGADLTQADVARACEELRAVGTAAFLPTLITGPLDIYERNLPIIAKVISRPEHRGRALGIHLEGPFINPQEGARGAHNLEWVRAPDVALLERLVALADGKVRLLTIAADLDGAEALARCATDFGITVSLGHHMADEHDLARLVRAGAKALTHLGNGVPALVSRHRNPIWAGLANDDLSAMIIADGHHLPASMLKTTIRTKGAQRCLIVSDASPLAGMLPGRYQSMGVQVLLKENGHLYNPATGYMAGSSATILTCANHLASLGIVTPDEIVTMAFHNPLKLIGVRPDQVARGNELLFDEQRQTFYQQKG